MSEILDINTNDNIFNIENIENFNTLKFMKIYNYIQTRKIIWECEHDFNDNANNDTLLFLANEYIRCDIHRNCKKCILCNGECGDFHCNSHQCRICCKMCLKCKNCKDCNLKNKIHKRLMQLTRDDSGINFINALEDNNFIEYIMFATKRENGTRKIIIAKCNQIKRFSVKGTLLSIILSLTVGYFISPKVGFLSFIGKIAFDNKVSKNNVCKVMALKYLEMNNCISIDIENNKFYIN